MPTINYTWPTSLDEKAKNLNFSLERMPGHVIGKSENGPPKTRRKGTFTRSIYRCPVQFTDTDVDTFEAFVKTIGDGVEPFYFTDPRTSVQKVWKFRNGNPPTFKNKTAGGALAGTEKTYRATLMLEYVSEDPDA